MEEFIECPECKAELNNDEKAAGQCFTCGATFGSTIQETEAETNTIANNSKNTISTILRWIGGLTLILGTIGSLSMEGYFFISEIIVITSGMFILGFAEIIQLLHDIKNNI